MAASLFTRTKSHGERRCRKTLGTLSWVYRLLPILLFLFELSGYITISLWLFMDGFFFPTFWGYCHAYIREFPFITQEMGFSWEFAAMSSSGFSHRRSAAEAIFFLAATSPYRKWIYNTYNLCNIYNIYNSISIISIISIIYIYLSVCLYVYLSIYLPIYLSICLSICLFVDLSIYRSMDLSIYRSIDLSIYLSIHPSICKFENEAILRDFVNF